MRSTYLTLHSSEHEHHEQLDIHHDIDDRYLSGSKAPLGRFLKRLNLH
jgi:hypothetical protein